MKTTAALTLIFGLTLLCACGKENENWVPAPKGLTVTPYKSGPEGSKRYLDVIYENFSTDTVEKIRYELLTSRGAKIDTSIREIEPPKLLEPGQRHLVPRPIGEPPADFDAVSTGKVWVVKKQ